MQKTINRFADNKDVFFLFINTLENKKNLQETVRKYMDEKGYTFNVAFDTQDLNTKKFPVMESYKAKGIPAKFIIDKEGNIGNDKDVAIKDKDLVIINKSFTDTYNYDSTT